MPMKGNVMHKVLKIASSASLVAGLLLVPGAATAQSPVAKQIVGQWALVSDQNTGKDGAVKKGAGFGPNPKGTFIFMANGRYASINTRPDIAKFASGSRLTGTAEENKAVVQGTIAHYGTYTVSPDGKILTLNVEAGTWPAWNGSSQVRNLSIKGDEMTYSLNASFGGTSELIYKRMK
jgi:hypothetical protein